MPFTSDNQPPPPVHLFRGAPAVRSWSRYRQTIRRWALCGTREPEHATEDAARVTCAFCLDLLRPASYDRPVAMR